MAKLPANWYIGPGVTQGLSANQAFREYQQAARDAGLQASRRQDFLRAYSEVRRNRENIGVAMGLPKDVIPGSENINPRSTVHATGFGQWVTGFQRTIGESDFIVTRHLVKSNQPLTPEEAETIAAGQLDQGQTGLDRVTLGVVYTGTELFTPTEGL